MTSAYSVRSVLISDEIDPICPEMLKSAGVEVKLQSKWAKGELLGVIANFDALIVRSATKVTKDVILAGKNLKLIGRAGTGVDNIDVDVATERGIIVMNTPMGNSVSAAELTCTLILSLARHVCQASGKLKDGIWDRKTYMGSEVCGKTLAVIGLGRIGREVATRMLSFGMKVIGYDPLVSKSDSAAFGVTSVTLEEIWASADYVTVHVPLIKATENLINKDVFRVCKRGVFVVNCARGGIINETDLLEALESGQCGGAALDVFVEVSENHHHEPNIQIHANLYHLHQEPPTNKAMLSHPKLICTPHLGASTNEAQWRVAKEMAEQIISLNEGKSLNGAINASAVSASLSESARRWIKATEDLVSVAASFANGMFNLTGTKIVIEAPESLKAMEFSLKAGAQIGVLKKVSATSLNLVNVVKVAKSAGVEVVIGFSQKHDVISVVLETGGQKYSVRGCCSAAGTVLMSLNGVPLQNGLGLKGLMLMFPSTTAKFEESLSRIKSAGRVTPLAQISTTDDSWHLAIFKSGEPLKMVEDVARAVDFF